MDAVDQLDQAVSLALQGSNDLKSQALQFVAQVESDSTSWLVPSLEIVVDGTKSDTTQFFALQVVDRAILGAQDEETLDLARSKLWTRVGTLAQTGGNAPKHIRNKLAECLKSLFVRLYADKWPSFFTDMLQLLSQNSAFGGELYAQVLLAIHLEIGDQLFSRNQDEQISATALKDLIRDRDARLLSESWVQILSNSGADQMIDGIIQVIAGWTVWTDVTLILPALPHIEKQLNNPATRNSATVALVEILSKKMITPDLKLELLQTTQIVPALQNCVPDTPEFGEMLARVVNSVMFETSHALLELPAGDSGPVTQGLQVIVDNIFPLVIQYFENEYDDTSVQLIPSITEYLSYLRRESRRNNDKPSSIIGGNLSPQQSDYLRSILTSLVKKSRYEPEDYDLGELNDEDLGDEEFVEFRAKLRVLQEQLAQTDTLLYLEVVGAFVNDVLSMKAGNSVHNSAIGAIIVGTLNDASDWTALELALYELSIYSDVARLFVTKGSKYGSGLQELATKAQQTQFILFGEMVMAGVQGSSSSWSHPANSMWYMQLVQRHAASFLAGKGDEYRNLLTQALNFFLKSGIQSQLLKVRVQSWYMFYRLIKAVKRSPLISDPSVCPMIFEALAPFLPVQVASSAPQVEDLVAAAQEDTVFNSQLYLYELCGILFAVGEDAHRSVELMRQLLATMFSNIDQATTAADTGAVKYLTIHHNIVALSSLTKGISDTVSESPQPSNNLDELSAQLKTATQMVVAVLESSHNVQVVRDACRQAFSRMLGLLEGRIIVEISSFIDVLLQTSTPADMGDFISFLGQLAHKFSTNAQVFEMFTSLCVPLFEKVFTILQQVAQTADVEAEGSTDAQIFRREVVASYMQLLINILNNNYGAMLFVENNAPVFESIYTSLLHYAMNGDVKGGAGSSSNQKLAVTILTKMVTMWGPAGKVAAPNFCADFVVPIFSDDSTYERLTELCWSLPATQRFNIQDAQSRMVLAELAGLQKALCDTRGPNYQNYLVQYLTGSGLDPATLQDFATNVGAPLKDFKRYFVDFVQKALSQ